jgi:hypothetical protein
MVNIGTASNCEDRENQEWHSKTLDTSLVKANSSVCSGSVIAEGEAQSGCLPCCKDAQSRESLSIKDWKSIVAFSKEIWMLAMSLEHTYNYVFSKTGESRVSAAIFPG